MLNKEFMLEIIQTKQHSFPIQTVKVMGAFLMDHFVGFSMEKDSIS